MPNKSRDLYIKVQGSTPTGWQRPSDWLPIPTIATGEEVFYGLFAVYNVVGGNRVAFTFQGNYTVDWGDGSALENVLSGVKAEHQYNYADVANPTSEGWRQALIKVIPTGAANLTVVNLNQTFTGIATNKTSQFMDIVMNVPNCTSLVALGTGSVFHRLVERVWIREIGAITTAQDLFFGCRSLQNVPLFDTSNVTNMSGMFNGCSSIEEVPLFNTGSVTTMASMFFNCNSLTTVPLFNTAIVTSMSAMFQNCTSLQTIPLFNTAIVTTMASMFNGCFALQSVPLFNTASVNTMFSMFINCFSLQTIPAFNSGSVTTMQDMFFSNQSLFSVSLNMSSVTNTSLMFTAQSLQQFTATGLTRAISIANNLLSATELNNFFTSLGTAAGAQLIQVQGNPGASTCDTTIATGKGFTVQIV